MKKGDLTCLDVNCTDCPFNSAPLEACTGFKRAEKLKDGLEQVKHLLINSAQYERIKNDLDKEVEI